MPTAKELFDAGNLQGAIDAATADVKANPADPRRRTFLFELLCFTGDWDRAEKQIDVIGQQSAEATLAVTVYRANIAAERERAKLFRDGIAPHFLAEPPAYVDLHVEAIQKLRAGDTAGARATLDRAEEERPALPGTWNGEAFEDFRDFNDWTAPVLELIVKDKYTWLALEGVREIQIEPPRTLRDLVWVSAKVRAADGTTGEVYLPTLYWGSSQASDDNVRLGRMTEWKALADDLSQGVGLRLFLVGDGEQSLLDTRRIELAPEGAAS